MTTMSNDKHYVPGTFYRICERTGFKTRSYKTNMEWTGRIVRDQSFEPRQPQDFVTGVRDDQTVPNPRPRSIDTFIGPLGTAISVAAPAGSQLIDVEATIRMGILDTITIMMANGEIHRTTIQDIPTATRLQLTDKLTWDVNVGATVINWTAYAQPDLDIED